MTPATEKALVWLASLQERQPVATESRLMTVFDLLRQGKALSAAELKDVKKVAVDVLTRLKSEKLRIERWRESRQVTAAVKTIIFDALQWLPQEVYTDADVSERTMQVYQHVYTAYPGGVRA